MRSKFLLDSQAKIDEEIKALQDRIRSLNTSRNSFSLINQLPAEVLANVFMWYQGIYRDEWIPKWLVVTHVCKEWRSIAFGAKHLWTILITHHIAYSKFASEISYPAPVSIIDTEDKFSTDLKGLSQKSLKIFVPLLRRARKVEVVGATGRAFAKALEAAPSEYPLLQQMDFTVRLGFRAVHPHPERSPFPPSLKRLYLEEDAFHWRWLRLPHLTHLTLFRTPKITVAAFLSCMSHMPSLSHLDIYRLFTSTPQSGQEIMDASSIRPKLQNLRVNDRPQYVTELLAGVAFKENFTLAIDFKPSEEDEEEDDFKEEDEGFDEAPIFFKNINLHLRASRHVIQQVSLDVTYSFRNTVVFSFFDEGDSKAFLVIDEIPCLSLGFWLPAAQKLAFDKVQKFTTNALTDVIAWAYCCCTFPNIQELVICDHNSSIPFLQYLEAETDQARQANYWDSISLVGLRKITFRNTDECNIVRKKMTSALMGRAGHGLKLQELVLEGGGMDFGWLGALETAVDKIVVTKEEKKVASERKVSAITDDSSSDVSGSSSEDDTNVAF